MNVATPKHYAAMIAAFSAALEGSVPALTARPAVAPAAGAPSAGSGLPALAAVSIALKACGQLCDAVADAPSAVDRAMLTAGAVAALGSAGKLAAYATFTSRDEAVAVRAAIAEAAGAVSERLEELGDTAFAGAASTAMQAVAVLATAAAADINEAIGRLPRVVVFETDREVDAFLLANHLYGERPDQVEAGYRSIVARNRPRHPAQLPPGRIEALK